MKGQDTWFRGFLQYTVFSRKWWGKELLSSLCLHTATATSFELCVRGVYSAAVVSQLNVKIRNSCRLPHHTSRQVRLFALIYTGSFFKNACDCESWLIFIVALHISAEVPTLRNFLKIPLKKIAFMSCLFFLQFLLFTVLYSHYLVIFL